MILFEFFRSGTKPSFGLRPKQPKHKNNNKFINQAENHRKEIVMSWCFSVTKIKIMKISEVKIGFKFQHGEKGECTVTDKTKRTITVIHKFGKTKVTYRYADARFSPSDF